MSYTPGPWSIHKESQTRTHIISEDVEDTRLIASVYSDARHPEVAANLGLIAAAPDLYEAAKLIRDSFFWHGESAPKAVLDAAIAKAEGREP